MKIKFIKKTPFAIDETIAHNVDKAFGNLMVKNGYAEEVKKENILKTILKTKKK